MSLKRRQNKLLKKSYIKRFLLKYSRMNKKDLNMVKMPNKKKVNMKLINRMMKKRKNRRAVNL